MTRGNIVSLYSVLNLTSALQSRTRSTDRLRVATIVELSDRDSKTHGLRRHRFVTVSRAAPTAGLSDRVIMNIAGIFAWDIDFVLDIREWRQLLRSVRRNLAER